MSKVSGIANLGDAARLHFRALEIAHDRHLPATYDAHHVALAERFRVSLWTCDRRLAGRWPAGGAPRAVRTVIGAR